MLAMCCNPYLLSSVPCIFLYVWIALLPSLQLFFSLLLGILAPAFFIAFPACVGSHVIHIHVIHVLASPSLGMWLGWSYLPFLSRQLLHFTHKLWAGQGKTTHYMR